MQYIVSSNGLSKQLQLIGGIISASNSLPILENFLFEIDKNALNIVASDLETTVSASISIESKHKGKIAVPARLLLDGLKGFSEQPLTFITDDSTFAIEISSDLGKYKLTGHNSENFPRIPVIESATTISLDSDILASALSKTIFATGNDDMRAVMNGVYCELSPKQITFVATDAHKLVRYRRFDTKSDKIHSFIIPKKPLTLLKNILQTIPNTKVQIEYNKTSAFFSFENYKIICRLIEGKYPNYEAVIPKENPNKLIIDREALLNSVRRVSVYSNQAAYQVKIRIKGNELHLFAEDIDFANEADERLKCQYNGVDIDIAFNSRFLIEMLSVLDSKEINIELSAPNRAGIITPVTDVKNEEILMLIMPVMLNN